MPASTVQSQTPSSATLALAKTAKPISWQAFQRKYLSREDGYKYEWLNGQVEKTKRAMDKTQLYILRNLQDFFIELRFQGKLTGQLIAEPDLFFLTNHRRPDVCWLTNAQIDALADPDAYEVPEFLIEVISSNDQINKVKRKLIDYRNAGVKVVWHIFPNYKQVEVYTGERLEHITILEGDQLCSAAPALPGFEMPVSAIFQRPAQEE
jgi:Uma2 family endonuclease